jgi:outer membrane protein assembly factor BamB
VGLDAYVPCRCRHTPDCVHEDGDLVAERIANWAGLRRFRAALSAAGDFPTLTALLPDGNYGVASPAESAAALDELARFTTLDSVGENVFLTDLDTGREIWASPGDQYWSTPYTLGYDANGVYVVNRGGRTPVEVFRAPRVEQLPVPNDVGEPDSWTRLTDLDRGTLLVMRAKPVRATGEPPRRMGVVTRTETPADYAYVVEPLTAVFSASVATGNDVVWI